MNKIIAFIIIALFVLGCKKELDLNGSVTGNVELSSPYNSHPENVKVLIENDHFKKETLTNTKGIFKFSGVDEGYYTLTFSLNGYGTYQLKDFALIGLGKISVIERTILYPVPDFDFQEAQLSLTSGNNGYTIVEGFVTCAAGLNNQVLVYLYFSRSPDVSNERYTYSTYDYTNFKRVPGDTLLIKDFIHDLPKGENWYVGIYIGNTSDHKPPTTLKKAYKTIQLTVQ